MKWVMVFASGYGTFLHEEADSLKKLQILISYWKRCDWELVELKEEKIK